MVYGLARNSGGSIRVESKRGKGTSFYLYLPRLQQQAPVATVADDRPQPLPRAGAGTVLVVEDERGVRGLVSETLREMGYAVLEASSGKEALPLGEHYEGPLNLLVTDVVMPDMNGLELVEHIAKVRPGIKVLYISGYAAAALADRGLPVDIPNLLTKPFSAQSLVEAVTRALAETPCSPDLRQDSF